MPDGRRRRTRPTECPPSTRHARSVGPLAGPGKDFPGLAERFGTPKDYTNVGNAMNLSAVEAISETNEGFVAFFTTHYWDVAKALYLLTRDPAEAEELAQEAMTRVYERWSRVRTMDSPGGYLYRTALNLHRKRARRLAVAGAIHLPGSREGADPARVVEDRSEVLRLLASLSVPQRQVVVLVEWLGFDSAEAAAVLGIKPASVRTRLHRAKEALRAAIGEDP